MTTAVILAGGGSRRFGGDKATFEVKGRPMISIVADVLASLFDEVFVAGGEPQKYEKLGLICYPDPVEGKGALGGVYNALSRTSSAYIFCCGCDMPLIKTDVVRAITAHVGDEDILVPLIDNVRQPLHAIYKKTILPLAEELVNKDDCYLPDLLKAATVRYLEEQVFSEIADYRLSFVSLNDRDAVEKYREYLDRL